jgi:hypothetical protein
MQYIFLILAALLRLIPNQYLGVAHARQTS